MGENAKKEQEKTTNQTESTGKENNMELTVDEELRQALIEQDVKKNQDERTRIRKTVEELLKTELENVKAGKKFRTIAHKIWVNGISDSAEKQEIEIGILNELAMEYRQRGYLVDTDSNLTGNWLFIDRPITKKKESN